MISVIIPTYNREGIAQKTYALSRAETPFEFIYAVGSKTPYKFDSEIVHPKIMHLPDQGIISRIREALKCSKEHAMMMSDDDILIANKKINIRDEVFCIPKTYYILEDREISSCKKQKLFKCKANENNWFNGAIRSDLVGWSAILPVEYMDEFLAFDVVGFESYIAEKILLCFLHSKGVRLKISDNIALVRSKKLLSTDQGIRGNYTIEKNSVWIKKFLSLIADLAEQATDASSKVDIYNYYLKLKRLFEFEETLTRVDVARVLSSDKPLSIGEKLLIRIPTMPQWIKSNRSLKQYTLLVDSW